MSNGIFITGTDTGVGKTIISCALALLLKERGLDIGVMKPIETGCKAKNGILFPEDAAMLKRFSSASDDLSNISPCRFKSPLAPISASMIEKKKIDLKKIRKSFELLKNEHDFLIVEGIGGLLVPIKKNFYVIDLINYLSLPAIVVCYPGLGTLNHTFLTIKEAQRAGINIKGIIINNYNFKSPDLAYRTNPLIIEKILHPKSLASFPKLRNLKYNLILKTAKKHIGKLTDTLVN